MLDKLRSHFFTLALISSIILLTYLFIDNKLNNNSDFSLFDYGKHFIMFFSVVSGAILLYKNSDIASEIIKSSPPPF
jgi:hypothetical protein